MTALEREARKLAEMHYGADEWAEFTAQARETWLALARYVLAERRRARGRTVAWAIGSPVYEFNGQKDTRAIGYDWEFFEEPVNVRMTQMMGKRVARVVAEPKKGGRRG